jgi:large subunit ribosomal protein L22
MDKKELLKNVFKSFARDIPISAFKLRPITDVIRNKNIFFALRFLETYRTRRSEVILKALKSCLANALYLKKECDVKTLYISEIKVDQGMSRKYMKPSAQGRGMLQKKWYSHLSILLKEK